ALDEFHIAGLATNLRQLSAILAHPEFRAGDARTSFLAEHPDLAPGKTQTTTLTLLEQQATALGRGLRQVPTDSAPATTLSLTDGDEAVECPMAGTIVEVAARVGGRVSAGDTLLVVSAMKMETAVTAPFSGTITALA